MRMKRDSRTFKTKGEAEAFNAGLEYGNDDALENWVSPIDPCTVLIEDGQYEVTEDDEPWPPELQEKDSRT